MTRLIEYKTYLGTIKMVVPSNEDEKYILQLCDVAFTAWLRRPERADLGRFVSDFVSHFVSTIYVWVMK